MICPACHHDMLDDSNCIECGFQGVGLCTKAWERFRKTYFKDWFNIQKQVRSIGVKDLGDKKLIEVTHRPAKQICRHLHITIDDDIKNCGSYLKVRLYCDDCNVEYDDMVFPVIPESKQYFD